MFLRVDKDRSLDCCSVSNMRGPQLPWGNGSALPASRRGSTQFLHFFPEEVPEVWDVSAPSSQLPIPTALTARWHEPWQFSAPCSVELTWCLNCVAAWVSWRVVSLSSTSKGHRVVGVDSSRSQWHASRSWMIWIPSGIVTSKVPSVPWVPSLAPGPRTPWS